MKALGNLPAPIPCLLRAEFCFDQKREHGKFYDGYMIGFCAVPGRVPSFQVVLDNGAQWARVPINMLCHRPCPAVPLSHSVLWDCFSYEFEIVVLESLARATAMTPVGKFAGDYLLTVEWFGDNFSEVPDQHKNHHLLKMETGRFLMYPNNRLLWIDPSWIKNKKIPRFQSNSHTWSTGA